jgi:hypothetical protein
VTGYRPMTLADLAGYLARTADSRTRWKLVWEFLEEYRWEPADIQPSLLQDEPLPVGDERWDALLAALAEHLAAQHDLAAPQWAEIRVLQRPWFPAELEVQRARRAGLGTSGSQEAWRLLVRQGPGGRVSEPGSPLLGLAELKRAFTALSAIASPAGVRPRLSQFISQERTCRRPHLYLSSHEYLVELLPCAHNT